MSTNTQVASKNDQQQLSLSIPIQDFRSQPIPSIQGAKLGSCFVRVMDLPKALEDFMGVNPRVPNRNRNQKLTGPVISGIKNTLTNNPENMAIMNQGIYLLVKDVATHKAVGGQELLSLTLSDKEVHGIVNGGHTFAAIRDTIEDAMDSADQMHREELSKAYVRLHIMSGIEPEHVANIAEGLNRSKQVDDPSLDNLRNYFADIEKVMAGHIGEKEISYHQGGEGDTYITEVLVLMEMFNAEVFKNKKHPSSLYNSPMNGLRLFERDVKAKADAKKKNEAIPTRAIDLLIPKIPEILELGDKIRLATPKAAKENGFTYGRMKDGNKRAGSEENRNIRLPFIGETMNHAVPNGWLYPMLAAFRANVVWDLANKKFEWKVPLDRLLPEVIDDLVGVCVTAYTKDKLAPDKIGKRESIYEQCYDKMRLKLMDLGS